MSSIPPASLYQIDGDGRFLTASAGLVSALHEKIDLARSRGRVLSCWAQGDIPAGTSAGVGEDEVIGDYLIPPTGADDAVVAAVYVRIRAYTSGTGAIYAQRMRLRDGEELVPDGGRQTIDDAITATGWKSATVNLGDPREPCVLRLFRASAGSYEIGDVSIILQPATTADDGGDAPAAWVKQAIAHSGGADRPLDVYSFRKAVEAANQVLCRYPRTLASHSFATHTATRTSAGAPAASEIVTAYYKIRRGPRATDCTLKVFCGQSNVGGAGAAGTVRVYVDGVLFGTTASVAAGTDASTNAASITITAATFTANTLHEVRVEAFAGYTASPNNDTITVREIVLLEEEPAETGTFVASANRVDTVAPVPYRPGSGALVARRPILNRYDGSTREELWNDSATIWRAVAHHAQHRVQTLIADRLGTSAASVTTDKGSATVSARGVSTQTKGARTAECWVLCRRVIADATDADLVPVVQIYRNNDAQDSARLVVDRNATARVWRRVGTVSVEGDSLDLVNVVAGFENAITGASTAPTGDSLAVEGFVAWEVIPRPDAQAQYLYDRTAYSVSNSIPDNDVVTGLSKSVTVPVAQYFPVSRVRVYVKVTHTTPTQLIYSLSNGSVTVEFRGAGHGGATDTWWSDASGGFIGDETPDAALSSFIGEASDGTWTLKVYDNAPGTTGTLDAWALELW
jgi:subtilisin-like proprotein convertase family protein